MEANSWYYLNLLSKEEIIQFLKEEHFFAAPSEHKIKFFKWKLNADKISKKMRLHCEEGNKLNYEKEIDRLGAEYNNSIGNKDNSYLLGLLNKRRELFNKLKKRNKEWDRIIQESDANDKLYKEIERDWGKFENNNKIK